MPELVISGNIVLSDRIYKGKIIVRNGRISKIARPSESLDAQLSLEFDDCYILPGIIDSHVHFRDPGLSNKEDFGTGSRAAAVGGVTTVIDMPNTVPWVTNAQVLEKKKEALKNSSYVDYGLSAALSPSETQSLIDITKSGAISFEGFTADVPTRYLLDSDFVILKKLEDLAKVGTLGAFYSENQSLWKGFLEIFL